MQMAAADKKRNLIAGAIIAFCLIGGGVGYYVMSGPSKTAKERETEAAAQAKLAEIQAEAERNTMPEPPPIDRTGSRGAVQGK